MDTEKDNHCSALLCPFNTEINQLRLRLKKMEEQMELMKEHYKKLKEKKSEK